LSSDQRPFDTTRGESTTTAKHCSADAASPARKPLVDGAAICQGEETVRGKVRQHRGLTDPPVVVLDLSSPVIDDAEVAAMLYGPVTVTMLDPATMLPAERNRKKGIWPEPVPKPYRPAAVLVLRGIRLGSQKANADLWLPPAAESPLLPGPWNVRTLGKRVGGNPSGVRIPCPLPSLTSANAESQPKCSGWLSTCGLNCCCSGERGPWQRPVPVASLALVRYRRDVSARALKVKLAHRQAPPRLCEVRPVVRAAAAPKDDCVNDL
jgi:hypothetical protein